MNDVQFQTCQLYIDIYIHIYVCMYICMYVYICTYIYTYTHMHSFFWYSSLLITDSSKAGSCRQTSMLAEPGTSDPSTIAETDIIESFFV